MSDFYNEALEFAKKHVAPYAKETDENAAFPVETFKEMGKAGYFKLIIPTELGGLGKGIVEHQEAVLAFAKYCPTAGLCYMMHNVALNCVLANATEETKKAICKDVVENEVFLALAYSEFGTGTHFYLPEVKAEYSAEGVVLNGVKSMVTSAEQAAYYLVLAPAEKENAINNWIVPNDSVGLSFAMNQWKGIGMRGNVSCPMKMDNIKLPMSMRIGEDGSGMDQVFAQVAPMFIVGLASVYTGLVQAQLELATNYSMSRKYPDGRSLSNIETVQIHLARIYTMTQTSEFLTREAARSFNAGEADAVAKIIAARINASENAIEASRLAMRIGGGKTYNKATQIERLLRDSYAGQIMAPSVDVLIVWLGKAITGQPLV